MDSLPGMYHLRLVIIVRCRSAGREKQSMKIDGSHLNN
jgi:hypothetical protein